MGCGNALGDTVLMETAMTTKTAHDTIQTLNGQSFAQLVLGGQGPIAVEFMSYGCGYCRAIEPILQQVARLIEADETVFRVNIEVEPDLAAHYRIGGTPTFVTFLDGRELSRVEGPDPSEAAVMQAVTGPFTS